MAPWQLLRAKGAWRPAPGHGRPGSSGVTAGYRVNHGPCYSTAARPACSRSFYGSCGASEKLTMQELNRRLAAYMDKVQCLEAANEKLEQQIQEELDRKCPADLSELDGHLQTVSLLQTQISDSQTLQAQVKLQLLSAELDAFDINARCEREQEHRVMLEADLQDLRLIEEELRLHRLPDLHGLLSAHTQELQQLHHQHQQDIQGLLAQLSGGVTVEMQCTELWDLNQQLDQLRQKSTVLVSKKQKQNDHWFNTQVSMLSRAGATCRPAGSEVKQAELKELRRTAVSLQAELTQLQEVNVLLEDAELEVNEGFSLQLATLQQRAGGLGRELDLVLEAAGQQAADYQVLLDIKARLETEIQDYRSLLDGESTRDSSSCSDSMAGVLSLQTITNSAALQSKESLDKTVNVERGNLKIRAAQAVTRDYMSSVHQATAVNPMSQPAKVIKSNQVNTFKEVHSKHPDSSLLTSVKTTDPTVLFRTSSKSQKLGEVRGNAVGTSEGAPPNSTDRESLKVSEVNDKQSSPLVHTKEAKLNKIVIGGAKISKDIDDEADIQGSKPEINTATVITRLAPNTQSPKKGSVQAPKPEIYIVTEITNTDHDTSAIEEAVNQTTKAKINVTGMSSAVVHTHITKEPPMQATKAELNTVTKISDKSTVNTEKSVKEEAVCLTPNTTENTVTTHTSPTENNDKSVEDSGAVSYIPTTEQSLMTANTSSTKNSGEAIKATTELSVSTSHVRKSEHSQGEVSSGLTLMDQRKCERVKKGEEEQGKKGREEGDKTERREEEAAVSNLQQGLFLYDSSSSKQSEGVMEGAEESPCIVLPASPNSDKNFTNVVAGSIMIKDGEKEEKTGEGDKPEINTATVITRLAPDSQSTKKGSVQAPKPEIYIVTEITNIDHDTSAIEEAVNQTTKAKINVTGMSSAVVHTQITKEAGMQPTKTGLYKVTEIAKTVPGTQSTKEESIKTTEAETNSATEVTSIDPDTKNTAEGPNITERSQISTVVRIDVAVEDIDVDNEPKINSIPHMASAVNTEESLKEDAVCHTTNTEENTVTTHTSSTENNDRSVEDSGAVSRILTTEQSLSAANTSKTENTEEVIKAAGTVSQSPSTDLSVGRVVLKNGEKEGKTGKGDKPEINTATVITRLAPNIQSTIKKDSVQSPKPEIYIVTEITNIDHDTSAIEEAVNQATKAKINVTGMSSAVVHTQITKEAGMQATKTGLQKVTEIAKTVPGTQSTKEEAVKTTKAETDSVTEVTSIDLDTKNTAGGPNITERSQVSTAVRIDVAVEDIEVDNEPKINTVPHMASGINTEERVNKEAVCHTPNTEEKIVTTHKSPNENNDKSEADSGAVSRIPTTEQILLTDNTSNVENTGEVTKAAGTVSYRPSTELNVGRVVLKDGEREGKTGKGDKPEINTATVITRLAPNIQSTIKKDSVQAPKPEIYIVTEITNIDHDTSAIEEAVNQATKAKINVTGMSSAVVHTQITKEAGMQATKTGLHKVTEIAKTVPGTQTSKEEAVKTTEAEINSVTEVTSIDQDTKNTAEGPNITERSEVSTVVRIDVAVEDIDVDNEPKIISTPHMASAVNSEESPKEEAVCHTPNTEENTVTTHTSSTENNDRSVEDSGAVSCILTTEQSLSAANASKTENTEEVIKAADTVSDSPTTELNVSTSHVRTSEHSQGEVSSGSTLMDQRECERVKKGEVEEKGKKGREEEVRREEEVASPISKLEQGLSLVDSSTSKQNKEVIEGMEVGSCILLPASSISDKNLTNAVESKVILQDGEREGKTGGEQKQERADKGEEKSEEIEYREGITSSGIQVFTETDICSYPLRTAEHGCPVTDNAKAVTTKLDGEMDSAITVEIVNSAGQGTSLSPTKVDRGVSLADSGITLSLSDPEKCLSPVEPEVFLNPPKLVTCLSPTDPGICLSPVEAEVFLDPINQDFCPVDLEEYLSPRTPDLFLSPNDPEICFSPNNSETCLSPVERSNDEECMSPTDDEACLSLTEANLCVRQVEKYVLATKEECQSLSLGGDQIKSEEGRTAKVTGPERDENSSDFGSVGDHAGSRASLISAKTGFRLTSPGSRISTLGDALYRSSLVAQEMGVSPSGQCRRTSVDKEEVTSLGWRYKDTSTVDNKGVLSPVGSPGGRFRKPNYGDREETAINSVGNWMWGLNANKSGSELKSSGVLVSSATINNGGVFGKSASFGSVPATGGTRFSGIADNAGGKINGMDRNRGISLVGMTNSGSMVSNMATGLGSMAANSAANTITGKSGNAEAATPAGEQGRNQNSGEWIVYGSRTGRLNSLPGSRRLNSTEIGGDTVSRSVVRDRETSPTGRGRFGSQGSGEWKVYGGSTGRASTAGSGDRLSTSASCSRVTSPPLVHYRSSSTGSGGRLSSNGSGGRLSTSLGSSGRLSSSGTCARRSTSVGSGGRLSSSGSGGALSSSAGSHRVSSSGRYGSTSSGEWKPVYGGASGRRSSVGSGGRPGGTTRTPSPGGRLTITGGSGGHLSSSPISGHRVSRAGSGSKLSGAGSSDRISSQAGGRISGSSGSGRTNSTGGRVISSSDGPVRSTGSGAGAKKERISVCKMAALSMSAAGKERSQERQRRAQKSQQEQAAANRPRVQHWLTTGVGVTGDDLDGADDIIRL